ELGEHADQQRDLVVLVGPEVGDRVVVGGVVGAVDEAEDVDAALASRRVVAVLAAELVAVLGADERIAEPGADELLEVLEGLGVAVAVVEDLALAGAEMDAVLAVVVVVGAEVELVEAALAVGLVLSADPLEALVLAAALEGVVVLR